MKAPKAVEIASRRFGKYVIRSRLGAGGMAEVFLAEVVDETGQTRNIAVKLMKKSVSEEAFADEADLMGILVHPNLVQRFEVGKAYGRRFIAMEFHNGGDLRAAIRAHRAQMKELPIAVCAHILIEVLKALAYFHQAKTKSGVPLGLIHNDVNPANIFFSGDGDVKLGDFGVAKSRAANIGPGDGITAGKLHYLSPEQTRGEVLTPASDLFALGTVLYELVVGYHPFDEGRDVAEVMAMIRNSRITVPDFVDRQLAQVIQKALNPDLKARYRTAGEFAGDLVHYMLDHGFYQTPNNIKVWLESVLGTFT